MEDNITADMDNITTPLPSNYDSYPIATSFFRFFALIQFLFSLFSLSMVIYLSIRLKKKAWDSPATETVRPYFECARQFDISHHWSLQYLFSFYFSYNNFSPPLFSIPHSNICVTFTTNTFSLS